MSMAALWVAGDSSGRGSWIPSGTWRPACLSPAGSLAECATQISPVGSCFLALGLTRLALQKRIPEMLWLLRIPLSLLFSPSRIRSFSVRHDPSAGGSFNSACMPIGFSSPGVRHVICPPRRQISLALQGAVKFDPR
ncbi:hypothetical protein J3F84DRAFT_109539 [Trichoderma pleuroticola]